MGICARVDHDPVKLVKIRLLDHVDQFTFMIALAADNVYPLFRAVLDDHGDQIVICGIAVDGRLSCSEHVKVGAV